MNQSKVIKSQAEFGDVLEINIFYIKISLFKIRFWFFIKFLQGKLAVKMTTVTCYMKPVSKMHYNTL